MKVTVLRIIPDPNCSDGDTCPALALTDRGSYVVVGKVVTDSEALSALGIGADEMAVEVPASLLRE
jgi:hypothetical protein